MQDRGLEKIIPLATYSKVPPKAHGWQLSPFMYLSAIHVFFNKLIG